MEGVNEQRIALFVCVWDMWEGGLFGEVITFIMFYGGAEKQKQGRNLVLEWSRRGKKRLGEKVLSLMRI